MVIMLLRTLRRLSKNRSGATAIEYGLIAALIGVAIIGGATALGGALNTMFEDVGSTLEGVDTGSSTDTSSTTG